VMRKLASKSRTMIRVHFFCILITPHYYSLFLSSTSFTVFVVRVLGYFTVLDV
jgi:hypothetical protein